MNPLALLITAMVALKNDLYSRFNATLAKLPPLEQIEAGNVALCAVREVEWAKQRLEQVGTDLESTLNAAANTIAGYERKVGETVDIAASRLIDVMAKNSEAAGLSAAITAKTHLPIEDHNTALDAAKLTAKQEGSDEAETAFNAKVLDLKTLTDRRAAAIDKVGAIAAASLKDADLLGDNHEAMLTVVEDRLAQLTAVGLTAESRPISFGSLMACAPDEAGTTEFSSRLEMLKESLPNGTFAASAATPGVPKPSTAAGALPVAAAAAKKVFV